MTINKQSGQAGLEFSKACDKVDSVMHLAKQKTNFAGLTLLCGNFTWLATAGGNLGWY